MYLKRRFSRAAVRFGILLLLTSLLSSFALEKQFTPEDRNHWSLQRVHAQQVPRVTQDSIQNPIDAFILKKLEEAKLTHSSQADKITLIRRATFDLIGLPPTPEEVQAFLSDDSTEAFARVIDRLLLSPHYGERWARHWLDLARYAESEGFKADETRPNAWRYRDYVIKSFNQDKPYDRFVMEQIAGDELWPDDPDALVATGFNRHYPDESNARNLMQRRQEILNDVTDTVGLVFTGLTYGCARCHDHKFDPVLQKDYFRLQAFFANAAAVDNIPLASAAALAEYNRKLAEWELATAEIRAQMEDLERPARDAIIQDYVEKYPPEIQAALQKKPEDRSPFECQMVAKAELYIKPDSHQYIAPTKAVAGRLKGDKKKEWERLNEQLANFQHLHPGEMPMGAGFRDISDEAPKTYVLRGGAWEAPTDEVLPGFLSILNPAPTPISKPVHLNSTGRRTALAKVLTDPANPLTARVMVNRIWQHHFGKGIVATPSDFGRKGEPPTHPELLDWLADQFVNNGWSVKQMHKLIMLSATYQQSSQAREAGLKADPDNKLLWRFPRHRLEGEVIRDAALAVSGTLNPAMGGPSVFPDLPEGMETRGGWKKEVTDAERNRRSIYVFVRRNMRYPMFETFDMPDTHESCAQRNCTTSPLQALTMLNNQLTLEWARHFANRVLERSGSDLKTQIEAAYLLAYSRKPTAQDLALGQRFFANHAAIVAERAALQEPIALPISSKSLGDRDQAAREATLVDFCHMLLNSNEFVYVN